MTVGSGKANPNLTVTVLTVSVGLWINANLQSQPLSGLMIVLGRQDTVKGSVTGLTRTVIVPMLTIGLDRIGTVVLIVVLA